MDVVDKMRCDSVEMREKAARICRDYLFGAWKGITSKDISLKRISGGLSNWLYHVSLPHSHPVKGAEPPEVLLRLYGQTHGENAMENIITESVIFALLSERQLGPKLHGIFPGGRIEEYIPARPLKTKELSDSKLTRIVAERMGLIHQLNIPISKEPCWLWNTIERWLQSVPTILEEASSRCDVNKNHILKLQSYNLQEEVHWLKNWIKGVGSPVLFCHNDFQEGNILLYCGNMSDEQAMVNPRLVVIDYEYCSYNYRAFDLANHFLEWVYDYTHSQFPFYSADHKNYPSREQQLVFIRAYLQTFQKRREQNNNTAFVTDDEAVLLKEVEAFTVASHFLWGLWSIVNARLSQIPFGYWDYAIERLESYFAAKQKLIGNRSFEGGNKRKIEDMEG